MNQKKYEAVMIPLTAIEPDEFQPRKNFDPARLSELIRSIQKHGIMNPLIVERKPGGKYLLVDGERRYRAATEAGFTEVPAVPVDAQSDTDRLVQQFHIQEQHEGWSSTEKASAMAALGDKLKVSTKQLGEMLSLPSRTVETYSAFAALIERKTFEKSEIPLVYANRIQGLKKRVRSLFEKAKQEFTKEDERDLELAVISRIKSGDIRVPNDIVKIGDAAMVSPEAVRKFIRNQSVTVQKLFLDSEAEVAMHFRRAIYNANGVAHHISKGMELKMQNYFEDKKYAIEAMKQARDKIEELLAKV